MDLIIIAYILGGVIVLSGIFAAILFARTGKGLKKIAEFYSEWAPSLNLDELGDDAKQNTSILKLNIDAKAKGNTITTLKFRNASGYSVGDLTKLAHAANALNPPKKNLYFVFDSDDARTSDVTLYAKDKSSYEATEFNAYSRLANLLLSVDSTGGKFPNIDFKSSAESNGGFTSATISFWSKHINEERLYELQKSLQREYGGDWDVTVVSDIVITIEKVGDNAPLASSAPAEEFNDTQNTDTLDSEFERPSELTEDMPDFDESPEETDDQLSDLLDDDSEDEYAPRRAYESLPTMDGESNSTNEVRLDVAAPQVAPAQVVGFDDDYEEPILESLREFLEEPTEVKNKLGSEHEVLAKAIELAESRSGLEHVENEPEILESEDGLPIEFLVYLNSEVYTGSKEFKEFLSDMIVILKANFNVDWEGGPIDSPNTALILFRVKR